MTDNILLGFQGWAHPQLMGRRGSSAAGSYEMLEHYSRQFPTVEVDDTFYGLPPEPVVRRWRESVPPEFLFALKAPQQVTHEQRFSQQSGLLTRFLDRASMLDENLGPILLLAPPGFEPDDESRATLRTFVRALPAGFNWALELRHVGWFSDDLHDLLSEHSVAVVVADNRWIRRTSMLELATKPTAEFAYVRWNIPLRPNTPAENEVNEDQVGTAWVNTLERLSSLVRGVYGYVNINTLGNGTRIFEKTSARIGQKWLEASVPGEPTA